MNLVNEIRSGFYSDFLFKCKMCNLEKKISSTKFVPDSNWSINKAAVSSSIAIGIGYTQLSELFLSLIIMLLLKLKHRMQQKIL
ncbi:unnamed protein product [Macrosiphum euphorbiae]|uniref:Mutator-like transposase domain-containing protein n=1 Tax=Macrosiphum euphorbiae TaxID=13131 RepID=A0AAV0Y7F4_9HEMI|nr:unnamed protein product [Macrosiphum euphorbiae]